jgi:cellulose synthase/poly-beta-1,6-N-acetylglucosamine synthase-like glycosyltransferase
MNTLAAATNAEFIVFSDANVMFAPDAITRLLCPFADPAVGCACGHLIYRAAEASATAATGSIYWRLEETIKELESRTGSTMGADGSIFAIRRVLHRAPHPISLMTCSSRYRSFPMDFALCVWPTRSPMKKPSHARERSSGARSAFPARRSTFIGYSAPAWDKCHC